MTSPTPQVSASEITFGASAAQAAHVKNVVLVHCAWVDGSGWRPVYDILAKDGYHVTECNIVMSVSEAHNLTNLRMTRDQSRSSNLRA